MGTGSADLALRVFFFFLFEENCLNGNEIDVYFFSSSKFPNRLSGDHRVKLRDETL